MSEIFAVLVGAFIALAGQYSFNWHDRKKAARYLAIRVVCVLDRFLADCTNVVGDDGEPDQDGFHHPRVSSPNAPNFPDDVDWRSIEHTLMYDILSFPPDVVAAKEAVSVNWDINYDPPDFSENFEYRAKYYAGLGLRAHELAKRLRKEYDIPEKGYDEWNPVSYLETELKEIEDREAHRHKNMPPAPTEFAPEKVAE